MTSQIIFYTNRYRTNKVRLRLEERVFNIVFRYDEFVDNNDYNFIPYGHWS